MTQPTNTQRRQALALAGAGLVGAPAMLAQAADAPTPSGTPPGGASSSTRPPMQDPREQYPKPPFPAQRQEPPGLTARMKPRPDHGESSYVGSGRLKGRRAFITGGDSGIGRAAAIAYAREGADVAIGYLPAEEEDAREVIALIRAEGRRAVALPGDIRTESVCKQLIEDAVKGLGGLDILVNNAAKQQARKSIAEIDSEQFDATFKTNIYAPFWLTKAALKHLKPGSVVINTVSVVAYDPPQDLLDYASTKGALVIFTKALAKQLAERGIRVNAVAPGPIWTPLQPSGGQLPDKLPKFGQDAPLGRPGQPAELAAAFVLLASQEGSYMVGSVLGVTGGRPGP
ncbi:MULTISPECIES: SDR family oxidoreductase [unclassified Roseateles]|uniref:SDR family oxidoreductase n=1 Tax=unclassified Roseateles TaxID=2626991 RepID=UPI000700F1C2|nr:MULTISPECIES: SDR family oxidoreductase [unclassified Roseateles]KQW43247.1 NAD(P)-dependent oxidoreductase [Pelomonas sp. Root405]KRA70985.1 NAD(P)-dependent oxidoreductase [Pelomonas sp. Root662]